ncbi:DJ-1/PfpI family protein [Arthrobacter rhombi]|uniref:DJ-1/PfpI family protein n=1 Tax=Arthrobacter rhombi TaxID=71253 RepID=UPI003FD26A67
MDQPFRITCLLFPRVTQLDLTGPVQVFSLAPNVVIDLVWHDVEPVPTDSGFSLLPTTTFAEAPPADLLMVPGGNGAFDLLNDEAALAVVRTHARNARYVSSVCTGAFVLGAAGLLTGKRATTHWASRPLLERFGAIPQEARVVWDGTLVTGGGVTSGIDVGLEIIARLWDEETAKRAQLMIEHDPHPPFDAGAPGRPDTVPDVVHQIADNNHRIRGPLVDAAVSRLRAHDGG